MRRRGIGKVLLVSGLLVVVFSTVVLELFKGNALVNPTPDYHGPIRFTVYPLGVVYVLALGSVISVIGLVALSHPKNRAPFLLGILIINAPLLYFVWRSSLPGILMMW